MVLLAGTLILATVVLGLYLYLRHRQLVVIPAQIQAPHITPDEPHPLWGSISSLRKRTGSMDHYLQVHRAYLQNPKNKIARMHVLFSGGVIVFDLKNFKRVMITENFPKSSFYAAFADLFGDGLVSNAGEKWEHHRKLLNPAFGPLYLKNLVPSFVELTRVAVEVLRTHGEVHDLGEELVKLAMDIIAKTGFGFSLRSVEGKAPPVEKSMALMLRLVSQPMVILVSAYRQYTKWNYRKEISMIDDLIFESIEEKQKRQKRGDKVDRKPDILDLLLSTSEENANEKLLTRTEIRDELITFFLAGHETTALTLTWALYELGRHPEVMEKVVKEVDEILFDEGAKEPREPKNEDLPRFKYMTMMLKETLRLYPPASGLTRQTPEDVDFDGHLVVKATTVFVPIYTLHRDPEFWKEPDNFDPERWNDDNVAESSTHFFAFSHGPRNCIGQQFFWLEAKVILSMILSRFKVVIDTKDAPPTDKTGTLKPSVPIKARFIPREY